MENINAITNIIFERITTGNEEVFPKFSIYRLMLNTFHKLVINPLMTNPKINRSPLKIYSTIYLQTNQKEIQNYISTKNSKNYSDNSVNESLSFLNRSSIGNEKPTDKASLRVSMTQASTTDNDSGSSTIQNARSLRNSNLEKTSFKHNWFSFDINNINETELEINNLLESFPSISLDYICNEYNVFHINSKSFEEKGFYKEIVDEINTQNKILINDYWNEKNGLKLLRYFSDNDLISNGLINISKKRILIDAYNEILELEKENFYEKFDQYLNTVRSEEEGDTEMLYGNGYEDECKKYFI
ncbi:MAG: hypothetical protein MJ252_03350 [archaeon]|nr:hypothetical protein [archaeon]